MADPDVTFEQEVQKVADVANIPESAPMTEEEQSLPADDYKPPQDAPAVAAKPEPEPPPERPIPPQVVPLAVHIRQREKYERELSSIREQTAIGNQRLQQLVETLSPPPPVVDRNTDPLGATLQEIDNLRGDIRQIRATEEQRQQVDYNRQQINSFQNAVIADETEFSRQATDYPEAVNFAKEMKYREYVALGLDHNQAAGRVQQDAFALAQHAFQQGASPSELVYRMAAALGYKKASVAAQQIATADEELAVAPAPKTQAEQAVEMRAAGAQRGKTTGGAASTGGALTFAELANLDNDEFAKMTSGKKWDKLFRGAG